MKKKREQLDSSSSKNIKSSEKREKGSSPKVFTTQRPKSLTWHKQNTVRTRACALQESFYPDLEVPYVAVIRRMANLLGIVDSKSILAYLGRPQHKTLQKIDHTKKYHSGKGVPITHYMRREFLGKIGYIELFGLGSVYSNKEGVWFIHWNHEGLVNEVFRRGDLASTLPPSPPPFESDEC